MGIFSKLFGMPKLLTKIANGVANVTNLLDQYEEDPDPSFLFFSAWIIRTSIIDIIETNSFPMHYSLYAPIRGHNTKMTIMEVYTLSIGRLSAKSNILSQDIRDTVQDILDKKSAFYSIEEQIPDSIKKNFK